MQTELPTVVSDDILEFSFIFVTVLVAEHVVVVPFVRDILILWDQLNVENSSTDSQTRLTVPVELQSTTHIGHVVGGVKAASVVQVFKIDV